MRLSLTTLERLIALISLGQLYIVSAAPSAGCANATDAADIKLDSMSKVDLGNREYLFYVPSTYKPTVPAPLILSYHGGSRDAQHQAALDQFNSTFFNKDYLVAYPDSVDVSSHAIPSKGPSNGVRQTRKERC